MVFKPVGVDDNGNFPIRVATALNKAIGNVSVTVNLEVNGVYPTRPDAPVVAWVGLSDPDAFVGESDYWVNIAAPAPLTIETLTSEFLDGASALTVAAGSGIASTEAVWIPASQFAASIGAPTLTGLASTYLGDISVWRLDATTVESTATSVQVPSGWKTAKATLYWSPLDASGGSVRIIINANPIVSGAQISASIQSIEANMVAPTIANIVDVFTPSTSNTIAVTEKVPLRVAIARRADHANDTNNGDIAIIGLMLTRLT